MRSNPTGRSDELRHLKHCIEDLIRVQVALQGLGRLMKIPPAMSEPRRDEAALQRLQSELAQVAGLTTMGELAASIAHEINQPLGAIINNGTLCLRLLERKPAKYPEIREALSDIVADANRANAIVSQVRAMTSRTMPEKTALQLEAIIADVTILARHELDKSSIEVHTRFSDDMPWVLGDRVQLQQLFLNLVINSIEAMAGVTVGRRILTISGKRNETHAGPVALITVQDNGIGFPPDSEHRIFDAFYTTKPRGMGMGLRICRSIVDAHGGRLWAKSVPGEATTFSCLLPAMPAKEP